MKRAVTLMIGTITLLAASVSSDSTSARSDDSKGHNIKVSIATGEPLGLSRDHFRAGEQIAVEITMTNTSSEPVYACLTSPLYQDIPTLTKNGQTVPYMNWEAYERNRSEKDGACSKVSLPEPMLLKPNEPTLVDWFVLSDDASLVTDGWYDPLPPGHYELSLKRRLDCCEGTMLGSNKVSFEVD